MELRRCAMNAPVRFCHEILSRFRSRSSRAARRQFVLKRAIAEILEPRKLLSAALINVQFDASGQPAQTGGAVLGTSGDKWNNIVSSGTPSGSNVALVDATNSTTSVSVSYSAEAEGHTSNSPFSAGADASLMSSYLIADPSANPGSPGSVVFSGLSAGSQYNVILYSGTDVNNPTGQTAFTVNGYTKTTQFNPEPTAFVENTNFVEFQPTADANGKITISFDQANAVEGDLNGVQLQQLAPAPFAVADVGTLPGFDYATVSGVNSSGDVVGTATMGELQQAFLAPSNGNMINIGSISGNSTGYAVNDSDTVVGSTFTPTSDSDAFVWTSGGGIVDIGTLTGSNFSVADGINNSGEVVGFFIGSDNFQHAFTWTQGGGIQDLPEGMGVNGTTALGINASGTVVGVATILDGMTETESFEAVYWPSGGMMQVLPNASSFPDSQADAINAAGQISGESYDGSTDVGDAVVWNSGVPTDIGSLLSGSRNTAQSINAAGQIAGGSIVIGGGGEAGGLFWTPNDGLENLNSLIPGAGFTLDNAPGINDSGQIAAQGTNSVGQEVPVLLTPTPPSASASAFNVTSPTTTTAIKVKYTSATAAIDTSTLDASNISVISLIDFSLTVTLQGFTGSGDSLTATYLAQAPGGTWSSGDDGSYAVTVNAGAVKDVNGIGNTAAATIFDVSVPNNPPPLGLIDLQFNATGQPAQTGGVILGGSGDKWNNIVSSGTPSGTNVPLVDTTNAATTASVTYSAEAEGNVGFSPFGSGPFGSLMSSYLIADPSADPGPAGSVVFSGLAAGAIYEVILYSGAETDALETVFTVNGYTKTTKFPAGSSSFNENSSYVDFQPTADINGQITISFDQANGMEGDLNGVQLQQLTPAAFSVTDVGTLPGYDGSDVAAVNNNGDVVGTAPFSEFELDTAFLAPSNGNIINLGSLGGSGDSFANAVNDSDTVVGQTTTPTSDGDAFVWTQGGGMVDIGTLPGDDTSAANGINNSGEVVGYSEDSASEGEPHAFTWTQGGGIQALPESSGIIASMAFGINASGTVVGQATTFDAMTSTTDQVAVYWPAGGSMHILPTPMAFPDAVANGINDAGQIVGSAFNNSINSSDAIVWNNGIATDIVGLPDGYNEGLGINSAGQVVGTNFPLSEGPALGFLWTADDGVQDLNTLIPNAGIQIGAGDGISNSGFIAASGFNGNQDIAVLLTPAPPAAVVQTPTTITTIGHATETVQVTYTSQSAAIDTSTIDGSDLTALGLDSMPLNVTLMGITGSGDSVTATYLVHAPNGTFAAGDNGAYGLTVNPGVAKDVNGNGNTIDTGAFAFHVSIPDTTPPVGMISAPDVTTAGAATETVTVTYTDDVSVDVESIDKPNISVVGPGSVSLTVTGVTFAPTFDAKTVVATYTVAAPGGGFEAINNGSYTVTLLSNQVSDESDNFAATTSAMFMVNVHGVPPTAMITAPNVTTAGGSSETITVVYNNPNSAIDPSTIMASNVTVTTPSSTQLVVTLSSVMGSGNTVTATYSAAAPGGAWALSANGTYTVAIAAGAVKDTFGDGNNLTTKTFSVAIADTTPPTVMISAPDVSVAGTATETVTVTYTDDVAVKFSTIADSNISVLSPSSQLLTVTGFSAMPMTDSGSITVMYTVAAPNGGFEAVDNGSYAVSVVPGQVTDTSNNAFAGGPAVHFTVNVHGVPPTAMITAPNVTTAGGASETITVVYNNPNSAIDTSTIVASNVTVTTPSSMQLVVTLSNISGSGNTVTATYSAAAPGGAWAMSANGIYTVAIAAGAVKDTFGDANVATSTMFTVAIADTTAPTAMISAPNVTTAAQATETVTVTYADDIAVKFSTIDTGDISVIGPGGVSLMVTGASAVPSMDANSITVMYTVAAPGGGFEAVNNGMYTVSLLSNQVTDTSSNAATATPATFTVNVHGVPPTAMITAANVTTAGGSSETITVVYNNPNSAIDASTIIASNVTVTTPSSTQLVVTLSNISGSGNTITATYSAAAPGGAWAMSANGSYTVAIAAGAVKDTFGDGNTAASTMFMVAISDATAPTGVISAPDVTTAAQATETVSVTYTDDVAVKFSTIDIGDISVIGPGSVSLMVTGISTMPSADAKTITATYTVAAPGGGFEAVNNGMYTVSLLSNQVTDTSANAATATPATFTVNVHGVPPTAMIAAPNVTVAGGTGETVTVVYHNANSAIDMTTIAASNVTVTTPSNSQLVVTLSSISGSGNTVTATYSAVAPAGGWAIVDNGAYTVSIAAGAVKDLFGDSNIATSTMFSVAIADTTPPTAIISAPNVTTDEATTETITVLYTDNVAIKASTLSTSNIVVLSPTNQPLTVTAVSAVPNMNAGTITATYTVTAPGGSFTVLDNGTYIVSLSAVAGKQVTDTSSLAAIATPITFTVNVHGISPTAAITAPPITTAGGSSETVTVVYSDPSVAINTATIGAGNLAVTTPASTPLVVTLAKITGSGNSVTATYTVAAPGGAWALADNGVYSIAIAAGAVQNVDGDPSIAASATFTVAIVDTIHPTAVITAPNVTTAGQATETITIVYKDNVAVAANTINTSDISIVGPKGVNLTVMSATAVPNTNAAMVTATYVVLAPGGAFEASNNGTYTVTLLANQVTDTSLLGATATPITFTVNAHGTAPSALIAAPPIATAGGTTEAITVVYSDPDAAIDTTTFASSNIKVTGPGGPLVVTFTGFTGSGNSVTAHYSAAAPGGSWQASGNGTYTVTAVAGAVLDLDGDGNAAASTTFMVAIPVPDTTAPTVSISAPDVTTAGAATEIVAVVYSDNVAIMASTIDAGDITIAGPDGKPLTVTAFSATPNTNAASITAKYTVAAPAGGFQAVNNGTYSISLLANQVSDTSGNFVAAMSAMFAVNVHGTAPSVSITAPDITTAGLTSETVTVVYTDAASPINTATLAASNLTVTGPGGIPLNVAFTNVTGTGDTVTATYAVAAPNGTFQIADDASYTVTVNAGAVQNDNGDANLAASTTFAVAIGNSGIVSTTTITASNTTVTVGGSVTFTATVANPPATPSQIEPLTTSELAPLQIVPLVSGQPIPTGTVSFSVDGGNLTTVPIQNDGTALFSATFTVLGTNSVIAKYSGDANYAPSTSPTFIVTVVAPSSVKGVAMVGGLDPDYADNGLASHDVGITEPSDLLVQKNFASVIIGTDDTGPTDQFGVARYNADGSMDTSFGQGAAVVTTHFSGSAKAVTGGLLANGNILVAGTVSTLVNGQSAGSQFALVEYNPDGTLDTSFGNGTGIVLTSFSSTPGTLSNDTVRSMAIRPNGEIFVAGQSDAGGHGLDFAIAAYNADGSPDMSFGTAGKVIIDFRGGDDSIASIAVQRNDDIVAAGTTVNPANGVTSVALARLLPDGALNVQFGTKGEVITNVRGSIDGASSVAIASNNKIVIAGFSASGSAAAGTLSSDFLLIRYLPNGKLDRIFGVGGIVITSFNQPSAASKVLLQSDGTIIASGKTTASLVNLDPSQLDLAIARYTANGRLDPTFAGTGEAIYSLAGPPSVQSISPLGNPRQQPALVRELGIIAFDQASDLLTAFNELTQSAEGVIANTEGGDLLDVGDSNADTVMAAVIRAGANFSTGQIANFTNTVVAGAKGMVTVKVENAGAQSTTTTFTIQLFASPDPQIDSGETPFKTIAEKVVKLKTGKTRTYRLRFQYPLSLPDGNYYLLTSIASNVIKILDQATATTASPTTFHLRPPFVSFSGSNLTTPSFNGSRPMSVSFQVVNIGDITATKASAVEFFASTDGTLANAVSLEKVPLRFNLKPGAARTFHEKLALPATLPAGTYTLLALLDPGNVFNQNNTAGNLITGIGTFVVG
jgi:uncharacterized delta-60 repeat protein